jgi:DNA-binding protein Fis
MNGTYLQTGHAGALSTEDTGSIQQIANALAGAGLHVVRLDELETAALVNALAHCNENRTKAAKLLGISVRTLQRKLKSLDRTETS